MVKLIRTALVFAAGYIMGAGGCDMLLQKDHSPLEKEVLGYERSVGPEVYETNGRLKYEIKR